MNTFLSVVSVLIRVVIPAAFLVGLLYLVFESARKKRPPLLTLAAIVFFVAVTAVLVTLYAAIRAHYDGQQEWAQERAFFFEVFADELTKTGDLQKAAKYMQTPEVKERTLVRIRQIVGSFRPRTVYYFSVGGLILLLAAVSLWIKSLNGKKCFPYLLVFVVLVGGTVFDVGMYYRRYGFRTDGMLTNFLRCQQEILMSGLAEMKTDLSIPEIVAVARQEAARTGYGYGGSLLEEALKKRPAGGK